jgi:trk system potassium uptake protein TrkH
VRFGPYQVAPRLVDACWAFVFLFIGILLIGTLLVAMSGVRFAPALTAAAAAMSNAGPALAYSGETSYADFPEFARLVLAGMMIAGRLEILALLALLNPAYWRG